MPLQQQSPKKLFLAQRLQSFGWASSVELLYLSQIRSLYFLQFKSYSKGKSWKQTDRTKTICPNLSTQGHRNELSHLVYTAQWLEWARPHCSNTLECTWNSPMLHWGLWYWRTFHYCRGRGFLCPLGSSSPPRIWSLWTISSPMGNNTLLHTGQQQQSGLKRK